MTFEIILQIIFFGIALSMDAFAVSVTDGLIYRDITKKRSLFIASLFGFLQGFMPLISYFLVELISILVGSSKASEAGVIFSSIVTWISFALLLIIGGKMLIEAIIDLRKVKEAHCHKCKEFSYKEVVIMGIATAIDALAVGVSLHGGISNNITIFPHVAIIMVITFIFSILGVNLGHIFEKLFKGKYEICSIIGGAILVSLSIWIVLSHYLG
jgi:putative Mn2+ efflux pump MntP